jgi:hypothetical protein
VRSPHQPTRSATPPESRSHAPPGTPLRPSRSLDLNRSVAAVDDHNGAGHAGGPMTANPGVPINVARTAQTGPMP